MISASHYFSKATRSLLYHLTQVKAENIRNISYHLRKMKIDTEIKLNKTELEITSLLKDFCASYNSKVDQSNQLELRITGGWVRDRLLGVECNDIDIAINNLSGEEFVHLLKNYLAKRELKEMVRDMYTIKKNPEKSKHLETCTTKLFGLDIDFVNLRSETYTQDSRVPVIECGTAEKDAMRRDATLNALFYNLTSQKIEDFTGRGISDLENGLLITPLEPLQTFLDDPLRVLRLIRFACRYNFTIHNETLEAMLSPALCDAIATKISRERVSVEWEKIICSNYPHYGLRLLNYTRLINSIFNMGNMAEILPKHNDARILNNVNSQISMIPDQVSNATRLYQVLQDYLRHPKCPETRLQSILSGLQQDIFFWKAFWNSVILNPLGETSVKTNLKKNAMMPLVELVMREGLKASRNDVERASMLTLQRPVSQEIFGRYFRDPCLVSRSELGIFLRNFGPNAKLGIFFNFFLDCILPTQKDAETLQPSPDLLMSKNVQEMLMNVVYIHAPKYDTLIRHIEKLGLDDAHLITPIIDGNFLSQGLDMKPGPWMGRLSIPMMAWQLDNSTASKSDALNYAKSIVHNYL